MSNTPPTVLQLARQGDPEAIAALMNRHLEAQGITAHVVQHDSTLQVNLEAAQIPNQADLVAYVKKGVTGLELATVQQLTVSGKQLGADTSAWSESLVLQDSPVSDLDFDLGLAPAPASDDLDLGFDLDNTNGADLDQLGDFDASLGNDFGGADLDLGFTDSPSDLDLDLGFTDSSSDLDLDAPADFDLSFTDNSASDFDLDLTDTSLSESSTDLGVTDDFGLEFTGTSADASDLDFDLGLGEEPSDAGATDSESSTDLGATDDFGLEFTDTSANASDLDFDLGLGEEPSAAGATDLDFDLEFSEPAATGSAADFDLDLALADAPAADLSFTEDSTSTAPNDTELDFDLDLEEAPANTANNPDLDLDFIDTPEEGASASDFDLDLGMGDLAMGDEVARAPVDDLDLDLGLDPSPTVGADTGLDFDLDGENSITSDALDLDLGLNDDDLDLDLGPDSSPTVGADTGLDFDLDSENSITSDALDLDLGLNDDDLNLNLGPDPSPTVGADTGLDFDLDGEDPITSDALDLDLGLNDDDLDLDLGPDPSPTIGADTGLDFDLDGEDPITDDALDLDLGLNDDDLDLDLGPDSSPTVGADTGLDFDLDDEDPIATDALDLDLGLNDVPTGAGDELDFDLGTDTSDLDLDFAAADQAALDLEAQQWAAAGGTEEVADFGLDLESSPELSETVGDQAAIAADDLDFDLNAPAAPPTAPDVDIDLDDLWSSSDVSPDLGITSAAGPADSTAAPWADDVSGMDGLVDFDEDLSDEAILADDFTNLEDVPSDLDFPGTEPDPLAATEFDAGLDLELDAGFDPEAPMVEESTPDAYTFPDLDLGIDTTDSNLEAGSEPLPPELLIPDELAFEDLGAAADLDLTEPAAFAGGDWTTDEPDLTIDADTDLGAYDDMGTYGDLGTYDDLGTADLAAVDPDLAEGDLSDEAIDTPFSSDFDLEAGSEDLVLEPLGMDAFIPEENGLDFSETDTPLWATEDNSFDPNLVLDSPADFGAEPESVFDPGLTFDAQAEDPYTTPNPFAAEPYETGFEADADMPFSTMELDQTVDGDFMPDLAMVDNPSAVDAAFLEQPEDYSAGAIPAAGLGLSNDIADDPAFEPVEFGNDEFESPGFESAGPSDEGFETDFGTEGFADEGFGNTGFDDEGFDDGVFNDSSLDSNGFIQDRNGVVLADDEPDATDDFIQEFGSDPSTHVSLTPDQFNDDGSVRRSGGRSGLPMRLIIGLGLGALALALVGLLLNGLLGRLRQPTPGGDPAITEPAAPPVDPAAVPEDELFRQAVNAAQTAANQAQTASTPAQWQEVANAWARAIELMQRVPASDPNYATAQQKAVDYQPNLDYARQNAQ
ncbi:hypothetical protein H6F75_18235 [Nodosilinea sp. FACHB-131]|uniref:hypothetical protein n=1 Tax=Cyanophyceae TaxID=3028117 RepID=UPI001686D8DB|nr:hypothetical protein [Nodosilinea sp. FACHB-131]MBD1875425.1 hypothetical protein [Nodosilinea sp. FACHB-131]